MCRRAAVLKADRTEGDSIFGFDQLPLDGEASVAAYPAKEASVATNGSESQIINHPTSILYKNSPYNL